MRPMTPEEAFAYQDRWRQIAEAEAESVRATSLETRLRQLSALMASRELFPVDTLRDSSSDKVRERWLLLRAVDRSNRT